MIGFHCCLVDIRPLDFNRVWYFRGCGGHDHGGRGTGSTPVVVNYGTSWNARDLLQRCNSQPFPTISGHYCRDLWTLVYNKATEYLKQATIRASTKPPACIRKAKGTRARHILDPEPAASAQSVVLPPARGQVLAQSPPSPIKRSDGMKTEPGIGRLNAGPWEESWAAMENEGSTKRVVLDTAPIED
jgi:hypothetical protein